MGGLQVTSAEPLNQSLSLTSLHDSADFSVAKQGGKVFPCFDYKGRVGGTVPASLGKLTGLRLLDMNRNFLSGELPPKLAGLKDMRAFVLDGNLLSGSFPPWLGSLSRLQQLRLDENALTGTLPPEIGRVSDPTRVARRINGSFNGYFNGSLNSSRTCATSGPTATSWKGHCRRPGGSWGKCASST